MTPRCSHWLLAALGLLLVFSSGCPVTRTDDDDDDDDDDTTLPDDSEWTDLSLGLNVSLQGVWGQTPNAVWMVGSAGRIFFYNGVTTAAVNLEGVPDDFLGVWGSPNGDLVLAVGENGLIYGNTTGALDGWSRWEFPFNSTLTSIWGFSATDVYVAGFGGLAHWDGVSWQAVDLPINANIRAVWGTSSTDLWVVGDEGVILRLGPAGWETTHSTGVTADNFNGVWGNGSTVYVVGEEGAVLYSTGGAPFVALVDNEASPPRPIVPNTLWSVWAVPGGQAYIGGMNGHIYRWEPPEQSAWEDVSTGESVVTIIYSIWGFSPNDIWAVGNRGTVLRYQGPSAPAGDDDDDDDAG